MRALANVQATLSSRGKTLLPSHLRPLRSLITPAARLSVLPALMQRGAGPGHIEEACRAAVKEMWIRWLWRTENPQLHPEVGIPFPPPGLLALCVFRGTYSTPLLLSRSSADTGLR